MVNICGSYGQETKWCFSEHSVLMYEQNSSPDVNFVHTSIELVIHVRVTYSVPVEAYKCCFGF